MAPPNKGKRSAKTRPKESYRTAVLGESRKLPLGSSRRTVVRDRGVLRLSTDDPYVGELCGASALQQWIWYHAPCFDTGKWLAGGLQGCAEPGLSSFQG